jgi:hypothetical protein
VYTTNPGKKQVVLGPSNEDQVIIKEGLREDQQVYLTPPEKTKELEIQTINKPAP